MLEFEFCVKSFSELFNGGLTEFYVKCLFSSNWLQIEIVDKYHDSWFSKYFTILAFLPLTFIKAEAILTRIHQYNGHGNYSDDSDTNLLNVLQFWPSGLWPV